jgi:hypothetical protein
LPAPFAFAPLVRANFGFDEIRDSIARIRKHHWRDGHALLDFQNLAHAGSVVVAPGRRKKRFRYDR